MGRRILLLGYEKVTALTLAGMMIQHDIEPLLADWALFDPRRYGKRNQPGLILADVDSMPGISLESLCRSVRECFGESLPILAATASRRFQDTARLLDAGMSGCLPHIPSGELFTRKIAQFLDARAVAPCGALAGEEALPAALAAAFSGAVGWKTLGEYASIHGGAAPRQSSFRRMAPPDSSWRGVLLSDDIDRFSVGKPGLFLRWSRLHLFRLPAPAEYAVREKVVLRRTGPPLAAAVDRSRSPVGPDVYSLIPAEGVSAGFIACILNSRLADFYFNRVAGVGMVSGRLSPDLLRRLPVPSADGTVQAELSRTAGLLAHFGANPRDWLDRQRRDELVERMEEAVFSLYGIGQDAREELQALHF